MQSTAPKIMLKKIEQNQTGAQLGWGRAPPPAYHTLAKDMSLIRFATHFTLGLKPCIIPSYLYYKYTCAPPSQNYEVAPLEPNKKCTHTTTHLNCITQDKLFSIFLYTTIDATQ